MISLTSPVETWAHGWPAGAKLGALCIATMGLFALDSAAGQGAAFVVMLALYVAPGAVFFRSGMTRIRMLWPFLAVICLWHLVTATPAQGAVIALRLVTAVGLANLVTMTTRLSDMIRVVRWLASPLRRFGMDTRALELGIALVIRFTPMLADKGMAMSRAWRARSPRRPGWRIVLPFTLIAIDDAEHVADALKARGGV
ncbi:energy-coupling factor transporter transmembrane protein EcfT [Roseovarius sp. M141]|uniref:energy-coupling factor transporter transmembrane component T family protein n=1 Tax=Roseovarius sp. M141 TaxID=2583806 RepID=UPI0020CB8E59|nr:energy-coupling factor transporter transmembrane component T [Roseovarius sp. M141]MCQ0094008.1 energy-coupling factor transporter transmembrane protein EcfT [Roseovarius sp. M141]